MRIRAIQLLNRNGATTKNYSDNLSCDKLREAVKAAWDAIGQDTLRELIASMPIRCQAVIDADGKYTVY